MTCDASSPRYLRSDGLQHWTLLAGADGTPPRLRKQLDPALAVDGELVRSWLARAERNRALTHPAHPCVLEARSDESGVYLLSRQADGISIADLVRRQKTLPSSAAIYLACVVLEALEHALQVDPALTHLDLDPAAMVVRRDGGLALPEFGLWGVLSPEQRARRRLASQRVAYASPELMRAQPADARSDVFSVGALLFEMLSGEPAFHGESPHAVASAIEAGAHAPLRQRSPHTGADVCEIVEIMLARDPEARFQSAAAARRALSHGGAIDRAAAQRALTICVQAMLRPAAQREPRTQLSVGDARIPTCSSPPLRAEPPRAIEARAVMPSQAEPVPPPLLMPPRHTAPPPSRARRDHAEPVHDGRTAWLRATAPLRTAVSRSLHYVARTSARALPRAATGKWHEPSTTLFQAQRVALTGVIVRVGRWPTSLVIGLMAMFGLPALAAAYLLYQLWSFSP